MPPICLQTHQQLNLLYILYIIVNKKKNYLLYGFEQSLTMCFQCLQAMGSLQCEVCLKEDGEVLASPLLPPLLHKHLGVLVYEQVKSCEGCSQLLQLWDDFSTQAKTNLAITHPSAQHQYAIKEMVSLSL